MTEMANELREYADTDDLFDNADSETILKWVNQLAEWKERQRLQHRKYQKRSRLFEQIAKRYLDRDEIERIEELAKEQANGTLRVVDVPVEAPPDFGVKQPFRPDDEPSEGDVTWSLPEKR